MIYKFTFIRYVGLTSDTLAHFLTDWRKEDRLASIVQNKLLNYRIPPYLSTGNGLEEPDHKYRGDAHEKSENG